MPIIASLKRAKLFRRTRAIDFFLDFTPFAEQR
jgi:hypothetical protein